MELRRVELYNFSSYAGKASFDFSVSKEQNIILIGGNNGAGKTSLFTAIKLALYGPLCFRYQGKNARYSARIKELMNHDAFLEPEVRTYVELDVALPLHQSCAAYTIHREWNYSGQKVHETYWVSDDTGVLAPRDRDFFQNYLFTVIPPNLFEFFFFDGEEISDFFSDASYHSYIRNAVLTLCGYDTFGLIKKFCDGYIGEEQTDAESRQLMEQLHSQMEALEACTTEIEAAENALRELEANRAAAADSKDALEAQFRSAGGLGKNKQEELNGMLRQCDQVKTECSRKIRDYVETLMPFCIAHDLSRAVDVQLPREEKMRQYRALTQQLSVDMLRSAMMQTHAVSADQLEFLSSRLYESISTALCPEAEPEKFRFLHDLSNEQQMQVSAILVQLRGFNPQSIIETIHSKKRASAQYEQISRKLRQALPAIDANAFFDRFDELSKKILEFNNSINAAQTQLQKLYAAKEAAEKKEASLRMQIQAAARDKTAYLYTSRISAMMDALISDAVQEKFKQIETMTLQMFREITHKVNLIDLLELDSSFNILLYKEQLYSVAELYALLENVGTEELQNRLGRTGVQALLDWFGIASTRSLRRAAKQYLAEDASDSRAGQKLKLYKRVELSQLSKGEKQVFLLSLYWAIIKSAGQNIPFIIDTPFARIDTEHREQLTTLFFPSVSNQVIILSTDEEVVGVYRDLICDKIAHTYLLSNEAATGRTEVRAGYFSEEGAM